MKYILRFITIFMVPLLLGACAMQERNRQYGEGDSVLQNSYWMLLSLPGQQMEDNPESYTAYIRFNESDNDLTGFTGCNRLRGTYQVSSNSLKLTNLSTSRAMCPIIEQENFLMAILEKVDAYRIAGEILTLFYKNKAVATFRAGSEPTTLPAEQ
jgi:heat shock protein HslJ